MHECSAGNLGSIWAMGKLGELPDEVVDCMCVGGFLGGLMGGIKFCMQVKNGSTRCGCVVQFFYDSMLSSYHYTLTIIDMQ